MLPYIAYMDPMGNGYGWGQISKSPWFYGSPDGLYHVLFLRFIRSVEIRWDLFTQRHRAFFWPGQTWVCSRSLEPRPKCNVAYVLSKLGL